MPQSLLKAREYRWLVSRLHVDDAIGREPGLSDGRRKEVLPRDTPQDVAPCSRSDSRGEQGSRRAVDRAIAATGDLVQGAARVEGYLKSAIAAAKEGGLFKEFGATRRAEPLSAYEELRAKAREFNKANPQLSFDQAFDRVYEDPENHALVRRERLENRPIACHFTGAMLDEWER
jgi:hypothetical protein